MFRSEGCRITETKRRYLPLIQEKEYSSLALVEQGQMVNAVGRCLIIQLPQYFQDHPRLPENFKLLTPNPLWTKGWDLLWTATAIH